MIRTLVVAVLVMFATYAFAHGWYPADCCSGRDCEPIHSDRVRVLSTGYVVDGVNHEEHHRVRSSPDQQYHACFYWQTPVIGEPPVRRMRCFFAPRPAS